MVTSRSLVSSVNVDDAGEMSDHRKYHHSLSEANRRVQLVETSRRRRLAVREGAASIGAVIKSRHDRGRVRRPARSRHHQSARRGRRADSKPISRWLSSEVVAAKRERRRLECRWLSTRLKYRRACRSANKLINESRRAYFRDRLLECDTKPHDKRWRIVNEERTPTFQCH